MLKAQNIKPSLDLCHRSVILEHHAGLVFPCFQILIILRHKMVKLMPVTSKNKAKPMPNVDNTPDDGKLGKSVSTMSI